MDSTIVAATLGVLVGCVGLLIVAAMRLRRGDVVSATFWVVVTVAAMSLLCLLLR